MRSDLLALDASDVAWYESALALLEKLARRASVVLPPAVAETRRKLVQHLETRVPARADTITRGLFGLVPDDDLMDTDQAARRLGITSDAMRLACRSGRFSGVARKRSGRWMIPAQALRKGTG